MGPCPRKLPTMVCMLIFLQPIPAHSKCTCETQQRDGDKHEAFQYKTAAIVSILVASAIGVCIPLVFKKVSALQAERAIHFLIKGFAAGVILATGFIHILPDALESLTSPCLGDSPWGGFPFTGFIAMMSAIGTLMMESFATGYQKRAELRKAQPLNGDDSSDSHPEPPAATHVHGPAITIVLDGSNSSDLIRHRVISQVLELGIVVHSVIIGISLGATQSRKIIKPLMTALCFHQFFEGMGLGGCMSQAKFKSGSLTVMVVFFSVTTPIGIAIGMGISKVYDENSRTALVVEGVLNSASAGILIYMALVDLLASDFMNPKLQSNVRLQLGANLALLLGASCMSLLAKWGGT